MNLNAVKLRLELDQNTPLLTTLQLLDNALATEIHLLNILINRSINIPNLQKRYASLTKPTSPPQMQQIGFTTQTGFDMSTAPMGIQTSATSSARRVLPSSTLSQIINTGRFTLRNIPPETLAAFQETWGNA